jgi:hypothetical protein
MHRIALQTQNYKSLPQMKQAGRDTPHKAMSMCKDKEI